MQERKINKNGVSLTELMFALLLLLFMSTVLSGMFFYSSKLENRDRALTEASHLAVGILEDIKKNAANSEYFDNLTDSTEYKLTINSAYVYDIDVETIMPSLKYAGVTIYYANTSNTPVQPDLSKPNLGKIIKMGTYFPKP